MTKKLNLKPRPKIFVSLALIQARYSVLSVEVKTLVLIGDYNIDNLCTNAIWGYNF